MLKSSVWGKAILVAVATPVFALSLASAQQSGVEESKRKVKSRINPTFPDIARRMNLIGKAKIEVLIASDGHVKSSRPVGGHPVLVQACLDAVKNWKFEQASEETTQVLEFEFKQ